MTTRPISARNGSSMKFQRVLKTTGTLLCALSILAALPARTADSPAISTAPAAPVSGPARLQPRDDAHSQGIASTALPATAQLQPLNLAPYYDTPASKFLSITGWPLKDVPQGFNTFGNVPFEADGLVCLYGTTAENAKLGFTRQVSGIGVSRKFEALYLYHATFNDSPEGAMVSNLILNYSDGSSVTNRLFYGVNMRNWIRPAGEASANVTDPKSKIAWQGTNSADAAVPLRFYMTEIPNPKPAIEVRTIDLISTEDKASSCFMAMTTGPAGLIKASKP